MTKLKLGLIPNDKPVKLTVELPARLHRDLIAYGEILGREAGEGPIKPAKLVVPMLDRFIADRDGSRLCEGASFAPETRAHEAGIMIHGSGSHKN